MFVFRVILDIALVLLAIFALYYRPRIGGTLATGLRLLMAGVFILSLTHLADTGLNVIIDLESGFNAVLHRGLNLLGFVLIFIGFFRMRQALEA